MNRSLTRKVNKVRRSVAFKPIVEETPRHDWNSHAADAHRYAALIENQMKNQTFNPPATTGLVQLYYPQLGI